jgi:hypothetical protein
MSVEDVPAAAKIKTLKKRLRVAGQFAVKYKKEASCRTYSLNKEDYGVVQYGVLLALKQ